jgi:subtilisin family serine protease
MSKSPRGVLWTSVTVLLVALVVPQANSIAQERFSATPLTPDRTVKGSGIKLANGERVVSVIVKFDVEAVATYKGGVSGLAATSLQATGAERLDVNEPRVRAYLDFLASHRQRFELAAAAAAPHARLIHDLPIVIGGVSMRVPESEVPALAKLSGVKAVYEDQLLQIQTDNSPQFVGATQLWVRLGGQEKAGEGVVVGVLDTGIWPEHPSFSDPDPSGKPYAPPPPAPGGPRACNFSGGTNPGPSFSCNNKLIGARRFMATYDAVVGLSGGEFTSARDDDGHGTHTSSTAAGNGMVPATIFGIPRGFVSGIAPRAHVAVYKVCGAQGCFASDSAAAVQQAILDGVDVINFSISGGANPYSDPVSLAFLDAYNNGVFVAASAGNSGPGADTTDHREPWVTTVAASTQNRAFENTITLTADGGGALTLIGASITHGVSPSAPVFVPSTDPLCQAPFPLGSVTGMVVVCQRGVNGRAEKGFNVVQGGGVGMILYNQSAAVTDQETDNHFLPASHIQFSDGQALLAFVSSHTGVRAAMTEGVAVPAQGDVLASFSARGGPGQALGVSKPDITAPGVQILAGLSPQHVDVAAGPQGTLFQAIAGTSMSSPHVAGAAALLKNLNPAWTPGQIKSAIMTTAWTQVVKEDGATPATPFDTGSGRLDLSVASRPGLTFSATAVDFLNLQDTLSAANTPSLFVPTMPGEVTVTRTATSEERQRREWRISVSAPPDLKVTVPRRLTIGAMAQAPLPIALDASAVPLGEVRHARLSLTSDNGRKATFPITVVRKDGFTTVSKSCAPTTIVRGTTTDCTISMANTALADATVSMTDALPRELWLGAVSGPAGTSTSGGRLLTFTGTLAAAQPPDVAIAPGASPAGGYLPLSLFGIAPIAGVGDDTVTNFNVPSFVFAGQAYSRIGVGSNGYVLVGGSTSGADVSINNQNFPDPTRPNNVLAPFWTDLNPGASGAVRVGTLTDGVNTWIVVDWDAVREFSTNNQNSFEVWIGVGTVEDVSFAYGPIGGSGELGFLTVGAENYAGSRGQSYYFNGTGTMPTNGTQLVVTGTPPAPGGTVTINFKVRGVALGAWQNCAELNSNQLFGTAKSCVSGSVVR